MFKDKELEKTILYKSGKLEDDKLCNDDLESITDITLNNVDFEGNILNIDIKELPKLSYLEDVTLNGFNISDFEIEILKQINKLNSLTFISCKINNENIVDFSDLETIYFKYCNIKDISKFNFPKEVTILGFENLDLKDIKNSEEIKYLALNNCNIKNFESILNFNNIEKLNIDGSIYDSIDTLNLIKSNIKVSANKRCFPIE